MSAPLSEETAVRLAEALEQLVSLLQTDRDERDALTVEPPGRVLPKGRRPP